MLIIRNTALYCKKYGLAETFWRIQLEFRRRILRPFMARLVEWNGNRWKLDGCIFNLDHPLITTYLKSSFVSKMYEQDLRQLIKKHLHTDKPTVEFGASIGVVSCITNTLLDDPKAHIVVEANPEVIDLLDMNKKENKCEFTVKHAAIAYGVDAIPFFIHKKSTGGSLHSKGGREVRVPTISLKQLLGESGFDNINLIVDIEGAEISLIAQEADFISDHVQTLFIEMHPELGKELVRSDEVPQDDDSSNALQILQEKGFSLIDQDFTTYVFERKNGKTV